MKSVVNDMERDALIEYLIRNVPAGCDVGVLDGHGVYSEVEVSFTLATIQRKKQGARWPSDKAKSGLFVLKAKSKHIPK